MCHIRVVPSAAWQCATRAVIVGRYLFVAPMCFVFELILLVLPQASVTPWLCASANSTERQ